MRESDEPIPRRRRRLLTPAQQVIPHEMLLLRKHRHDDQSVQVDALAQHPEVVTAQQVQVDEHQQLTAGLQGRSRVSRHASTKTAAD